MWRVVGYSGAALLAFVVECHVMNRFGRAWGMGLLIGLVLVPQSTERARQLMNLFRRHIEAHLSMKEAAMDMGISQPQLSNWLSLKEHPQFDRLAGLPDVVWQGFCQDFLEGHGFVVVPSGRVASATSAMLALEAAVLALGLSTKQRQEVA